MADYLEAKDIEDLRAAAIRLSVAAERFQAKITANRSNIDANEGGDAWGDDKYGHEFTKSYHGEGSGNLADESKDNLMTAAGNAKTAGDAVVSAMDTYLAADATNAADLRALGQDT